MRSLKLYFYSNIGCWCQWRRAENTTGTDELAYSSFFEFGKSLAVHGMWIY